MLHWNYYISLLYWTHWTCHFKPTGPYSLSTILNIFVIKYIFCDNPVLCDSITSIQVWSPLILPYHKTCGCYNVLVRFLHLLQERERGKMVYSAQNMSTKEVNERVRFGQQKMQLLICYMRLLWSNKSFVMVIMVRLWRMHWYKWTHVEFRQLWKKHFILELCPLFTHISALSLARMVPPDLACLPSLRTCVRVVTQLCCQYNE
jgi:hypothetical protein